MPLFPFYVSNIHGVACHRLAAAALRTIRQFTILIGFRANVRHNGGGGGAKPRRISTIRDHERRIIRRESVPRWNPNCARSIHIHNLCIPFIVPFCIRAGAFHATSAANTRSGSYGRPRRESGSAVEWRRSKQKSR